MINRLKLLAVTLLLWMPVHAQQYLYVTKSGELPAERLARMDEVRIKTLEGEEWVKGRIRSIDVTSVEIDGYTFQLDDIQAIKLYNGWLKVGGNALMIFSAIPLFNRLVNGDRPILYPVQIVISSGIFVTGLTMRLLSPNIYDRSEGYTFKVIDLNSYE